MRLIALLLMIAVPSLVQPAEATSVTPINIEMTSAGQRARAQIVVSNPASVPVAIEPAASQIVLDEHGKSSTTPGTDDFLILPTQALIAPGGSQTFRVQWLGPADLSESRSYLVTMNQLPLQGLTSKAELQFIISFAVAVNVAPAQGRGAISLVGSGVHSVKGERKPYIVVENPAQMHALLKDATVTLSASGWSTTLPAGSLQAVLGTGLVQPGRRRMFLLPVPLPAHVTQITAQVDYRPAR